MKFLDNLRLSLLNAFISFMDFAIRIIRPRETVPIPELPFTIPILLISYYPVRDGLIDIEIAGDVNGPLEDMREHVMRTTQRVIEALEQGSRYHAYKDANAQPSLRYEIVDQIEFFEPLPTYTKSGHRLPMTDYSAMMARINVRQWVEERGVKEIWLWSYAGNKITGWESNMAGPFGDISNSDRDPTDLPRLSKTYIVYHYNYQRGPSEATEDHMHQIEATLREIDYDLFWNKFVGKTGEGRCGWAHFPPNGERDYDWANETFIETDIEDWTPEGGGSKKRMNCERWNRDSLTWFTFWMQNLPGADNGLTYRDRPLTNWWTFIGAFDEAMTNRMKLVE
jgi:hypothetical protein